VGETAFVTDILAIVGEAERDGELLDELARRKPDRVTVLLEEREELGSTDECRSGRAKRERVAALVRAIEERTGAIVVGLVRSRDQLRGWRFDRIVGGSAPQMA
jgi:hypothetical protein